MRNQILKTLLSVACVTLFAGCASHDPLRSTIGSYRNYTEIKGKIADGRYTSPVKNFSCTVPELLKPGAVIRDSANDTGDGWVGTVGFEDDLGQLLRVDWMEIPKDMRAGLTNAVGEEKLLEHLVQYLGYTYKQLSPKAQLETRETISENGSLTIFVVFYLPGGSSISENGKRLDCRRASLIYRKGNWGFTLTTQDTNVLGERPPTLEKNHEMLKQKLMKFREGFKYE